MKKKYILDVYLDNVPSAFIRVHAKFPKIFGVYAVNEECELMKHIRRWQEIWSGGKIDFPSDCTHFWIGKYKDKGSYIPEIKKDAMVSLLTLLDVPIEDITIHEYIV